MNSLVFFTLVFFNSLSITSETISFATSFIILELLIKFVNLLSEEPISFPFDSKTVKILKSDGLNPYNAAIVKTIPTSMPTTGRKSAKGNGINPQAPDKLEAIEILIFAFKLLPFFKSSIEFIFWNNNDCSCKIFNFSSNKSVV